MNIETPKIYYVKNINLKERVHYENIKINNDNNIGRKKKLKKLHTLCLQERSKRLSLILMQNDKGPINNIYRLIKLKSRKDPLPLFNGKKINENKKNYNTEFQNENSHNHIVDINKFFIHDLQNSINVNYNNYNLKNNFYPLSARERKNKKKILMKTMNQKIKYLSPEISEKILINKKKLPVGYKNLKGNLDKNNNFSFNKKINLKDILFFHNSNIRNSVSQFKVQNYNFHFNLKLKDKKSFNLTNKKNKSPDSIFHKSLNDVYF